MAYVTREQWLNAFMEAARPQFIAVSAPLPDKVRVGFTSSGKKGRSIGECWSDICSEDGHFEIFLKPTTQTDARIADILTHELVHAAVGLDARHGPKFKKVATALGLGGKMTSTVATEGWYRWALPILTLLGPMPYAAMQLGQSSAKPKQKTNLLKCECDACGFIGRITAKWAYNVTDRAGAMRCPDPDCDGNFQVVE